MPACHRYRSAPRACLVALALALSAGLGRTPLLHFLEQAIEQSDPKSPPSEAHLLSILDDLIAAKVDLNAKLRNGATALDVARSEDFPIPPSLAKRLEQAGAIASGL